MSAQKLIPMGPGQFEARGGCTPALIPQPQGSCLVLKGRGGEQAMHCVPPVEACRISITLRRMGPERGDVSSREIKAYERLHGFWEEAEREAGATRGGRQQGGGAITIK